MLNDTEALVILTSIPHLGAVKSRLLIEHFGSASAALEADPVAVAALPDIGQKIAQSWSGWRQDKKWKRNLELAKRHQVEIIPTPALVTLSAC